MDHDHAEDYYYFGQNFYESILLDLADYEQVFYAQTDDGAIVAAAIMLIANGYMNYHLGGSLREYSTLALMNQLFYKAARRRFLAVPMAAGHCTSAGGCVPAMIVCFDSNGHFIAGIYRGSILGEGSLIRKAMSSFCL